MTVLSKGFCKIRLELIALLVYEGIVFGKHFNFPEERLIYGRKWKRGVYKRIRRNYF